MPQIVHNHKTRCAGLSLDMFFFSITGNVTYVASILFKSVQRRYILANLPWLWCVVPVGSPCTPSRARGWPPSSSARKPTDPHFAVCAQPPTLSGSGLTVFLDIIVLSQFVYFSRQPQPLLLAADDEARE